MRDLLFLHRFLEVPKELKPDEYVYLRQINRKIARYFERRNNSYHLTQPISDDTLSEIDKVFDDFLDLWMIDNGNGMTSRIIEGRWMVIGTDAKDKQSKSTSG